MDDLYDNLDNYEDQNLIEQLKNENIELKNKLEAYTKTVDKLQKDFDRVSSDFKKMELNYSSLLKTAKVEIERKTKIIKDLNKEKDMIVLKSLQNKNHINIRNLRNITKPFEKGPMTDGNFGKNTNLPVADNLKAKCDTTMNSGRKEESRFSSVDTVTSCNTDVTSRLLKLAGSNTESVEQWSDRTSDTKENLKKDVEESGNMKTRALSIRNRRKSMPAARSQAKFSSDEECEETYNRNEKYKKFYQSREDNSRQNVDKYHDRYRHKGLEDRNKVSETSSVEDRYSSGYEPNNRDTYHRNRNDKYGIDKHRTRDRYVNTQRNKRYVSPDRSRRPNRPEGIFQRQEYGRHRLLESPPPDKFHHYDQRNRESNRKHERDDLFDRDRRDCQLDKFPIKHKIVSEHREEPISKRQRTDSLSKYAEEEKRWAKDKGLPLEKSVSDLLEEMPQYTSCQSPDDYLLSDDGSHHVKEIMTTAAIPLEDPRPQSKKYVLKNTDKNAELSTVTGRNVDLKMIDLSQWGMLHMEKVDVPKALTTIPSQCNDEIISEIYMDIENPISNMSAESGEIVSCNEGESYNVDINRKSQLQSSKRQSIQADKKSQNDLKDADINNPSKLNSKENLVKPTYKIPKLKSSTQDKPPIQSNMPSISTGPDPLDKTKLTDDRSRHCKTMKTRLDHVSERATLKESEEADKLKCKVSKSKSNNKTSSLKQEQKNTDFFKSAKQIVADDLELSDETCDNTEILQKTVVDNNTHLIQKLEPETKTKNIVENKVSEHKSSHKDSESKSFDSKPDNTVKDEHKKQRGKKRVSKTKETDKIDEANTVTDKKEKVKKDKKSKFNELFGGDSNSLMTPEDFGTNSLISPDDLGIVPVVQDPQQSAVEYMQICEDAQDAVDINVTEAAKEPSLSVPLQGDVANEVVEPQSSKNDKPSKSKSKPVNDTKKRKPKKTESDCVVPVQDPPTQTETCQSLVANVPIAMVPLEEPILISPIEPLPPIVTEVTMTDSIQGESADKISVVKSVLHKHDGLLKALATSTPHKALVPDSSDMGGVRTVTEPSSSAKECLGSVDGDAGNASSTTETADEQKETDVPDVRIFVKRRRRVIKK